MQAREMPRQGSPVQTHTAMILRMNAAELREYLREEMETNPALEEGAPAVPAQLTGASREELQRLDRLCAGDAQYASSHRETAADGPITGPETETLYQHLKAQVNFRALSPARGMAVELLLQSISPSGRLDEPLEELAEQSGISSTEMQKALQVVQELNPAGVAARDLEECLELQLHRQGERGLPLIIVRWHLDDLAQNRIQQIIWETGATREEVETACQLVRSLDPKPGAAYGGQERVGAVLPEILVELGDCGPAVVLQEGRVPALQISPFCLELMQAGEAEVQAYLQEKLRQAKDLMDAVELRQKALLRCAQAIVARQENFFRHGPKERNWLSYDAIAADLSVQVSTVFNAVHGKYLRCRYGVFPLKYFFN